MSRENARRERLRPNGTFRQPQNGRHRSPLQSLPPDFSGSVGSSGRPQRHHHALPCWRDESRLRIQGSPLTSWSEKRSDGSDAMDKVVLRVQGCEPVGARSEEHTSELQSLAYLVCRLLLE